MPVASVASMHLTRFDLDRDPPGALFDPASPVDGPGGSVVTNTTAGWNRDGLDMNRALTLSHGETTGSVTHTLAQIDRTVVWPDRP